MEQATTTSSDSDTAETHGSGAPTSGEAPGGLPNPYSTDEAATLADGLEDEAARVAAVLRAAQQHPTRGPQDPDLL